MYACQTRRVYKTKRKIEKTFGHLSQFAVRVCVCVCVIARIYSIRRTGRGRLMHYRIYTNLQKTFPKSFVFLCVWIYYFDATRIYVCI